MSHVGCLLVEWPKLPASASMSVNTGSWQLPQQSQWMAIREAASLSAADACAYAEPRFTCCTPRALVVAGATVVVVREQVDARELAPGKPGSAPWVKANSLVADWRRVGTDVAACAAVIWIGIQRAAHAVAPHCTFDAGVKAIAADALAKLIGTRRRAAEAATAAVIKIVLQVGAVGSTTGLAIVAAVVATGSAVGVGRQITAHSVANGAGAADIIST
jgi:hypothetical protein